MANFYCSSQYVLGHEVELAYSANGKTATIYANGQTLGHVNQMSCGKWISSADFDRHDSLQNHLELMVRASKVLQS